MKIYELIFKNALNICSIYLVFKPTILWVQAWKDKFHCARVVVSFLLQKLFS